MEQESNRAGRAGRDDKYSFRNLLLWKKGQELALQVVKLAEHLPKTVGAGVMARQVVAAAASIPANIAEWHGRYSRAAYRNHLSIARGSASEVVTWLDLLARAGYIDVAVERPLSKDCDDLLAGLTSQMRALERRIASDRGGRIAEGGVEYCGDFEITPDD